ncbi:MAG: hypothetical protein ACE5KG_03710 [Nitrososphaerales archaeon]
MHSVGLGLDDLAKYPFIQQAGDRVKTLDVSLEDLEKPDFKAVVIRARERVEESFGKKRFSSLIHQPDVEILSFPLSMALVRASGLDHLMRRYSLSEAKRIEGYLEKETKEVLKLIFDSFLNFQINDGGGKYEGLDYKVNLEAFLMRSVHFHTPEWKLINHKLVGGFVYLRKRDLVRLVREEIRGIIEKRLKDIDSIKLPEKLSEIVQEIIRETPPPVTMESIGVPSIGYPPCVNHGIEVLAKGDNLHHMGRLLLATYMLKIGKSVDEVISLYQKAPDFNLRTTKYQVEHLAGLKGGRTKYNSPSCKTLVTNNLCFRDPKNCYGIANPLQYGRRPKRKDKDVKK